MHMPNLSSGVSMVDSIIQYVWMTLMHSGWSTVGKSLFLLSSKIPSLKSRVQG
jgi:hypothetical protein